MVDTMSFHFSYGGVLRYGGVDLELCGRTPPYTIPIKYITQTFLSKQSSSEKLQSPSKLSEFDTRLSLMPRCGNTCWF